jgi:ketosteroid isomerase-like protein
MYLEFNGSAEDQSAFSEGQTEGAIKDQKAASTREVLDRHLRCFGERNLSGILSDYAPGAVMFTETGPLRGIDEIRPLFEAMIAEFAKPGSAFNMKLQSVEGDCGYILWNAETSDTTYELGTDTFVVKAGKIVAQSFTSKTTPKV